MRAPVAAAGGALDAALEVVIEGIDRDVRRCGRRPSVCRENGGDPDVVGGTRRQWLGSLLPGLDRLLLRAAAGG